MTDAIRPPDPADEFRRALDGALASVRVARVGLDLLERHLDGRDLGADRNPVLHNLADAADRLRDEVRALTELADAVFGGTDRVISIK